MDFTLSIETAVPMLPDKHVCNVSSKLIASSFYPPPPGVFVSTMSRTSLFALWSILSCASFVAFCPSPPNPFPALPLLLTCANNITQTPLTTCPSRGLAGGATGAQWVKRSQHAPLAVLQLRGCALPCLLRLPGCLLAHHRRPCPLSHGNAIFPLVPPARRPPAPVAANFWVKLRFLPPSFLLR